MVLDRGLEFADGDLHAATVDDVLQPVDVVVERCVVALARDFENLAGPEEAIRVEVATIEAVLRGPVARKQRGTAKQQFAGSFRLRRSRPRLEVAQACFDDRRDPQAPVCAMPCRGCVATAEAREVARAPVRIGGDRRPAHERHAFGGSERVDDLDAITLLEAGDHPRIERRRTAQDAADRAHVAVVERVRFSAARSASRAPSTVWLMRSASIWSRNDFHVERLMQREQPLRLEPRHEQAAVAGGVHHLHRRKNAFARLQPAAIRAASARRVPCIVVARHAFRIARGARTSSASSRSRWRR